VAFVFDDMSGVDRWEIVVQVEKPNSPAPVRIDIDGEVVEAALAPGMQSWHSTQSVQVWRQTAPSTVTISSDSNRFLPIRSVIVNGYTESMP
jgi:hypothetical protein